MEVHGTTRHYSNDRVGLDTSSEWHRKTWISAFHLGSCEKGKLDRTEGIKAVNRFPCAPIVCTTLPSCKENDSEFHQISGHVTMIWTSGLNSPKWLIWPKSSVFSDLIILRSASTSSWMCFREVVARYLGSTLLQCWVLVCCNTIVALRSCSWDFRAVLRSTLGSKDDRRVSQDKDRLWIQWKE